MLAIEFDPGDIERQLSRLAKSMGIGVQQVTYDQMRLFTQDVMRMTPPKTYAQGRKRVAKDINKLFTPMSSAEIAAEWEIPGLLGGAHAFKTKKGVVYGVESDLYMPAASHKQMRAHHQKYRLKSGRVTTARGGSEVGRNTLNIGRWKFVDKMHVRPGTLKGYISQVQKHVGRLKAGWVNAAEHWGNKAGQPAKVANWIQKNANREGRAEGVIRPSGSGDIASVNSVPYADAKIKPSMVSAAQRTRQRDIATHMEKRADKIVSQFNKAA